MFFGYREFFGRCRAVRTWHAHAEICTSPRDLPFATIPLLFAVQQLSEGVVWLTFSYKALGLNAVMTHVYSFFSHALWPIYVPVAVTLIEPPGSRRRVLLAFVAVGIGVGLELLYILVAYPVVSRPIGQHIQYDSPHFYAGATMALYLLSITFSSRSGASSPRC